VIDRLTRGAVGHLAVARDLAVSAGAVSLLAAIDLEIAQAHLGLADPDRASTPLTESLHASRRYRLGLLPDALAAASMLHALSSDRPGVDAVVAEATERFGCVPGAVIASGRPVLALVQGDDQEALARLDEAAAIANSDTGAWWLGLRALLGLVVRGDGGRSGQIHGSGLPGDPTTRAYVRYGAAVVAGRAGQAKEADAAVDAADALMPPGWRRHHARRLVAEAALPDFWGNPAAWAGEALEFFDGTGLARLAVACRATLRHAGVPTRRRGRGESQVPPELYRLGVTSREIDILCLLAERMTNREIGDRLFVSPRTVETHVASLLRKAGLDTRAQLAELGRRYCRGDGR